MNLQVHDEGFLNHSHIVRILLQVYGHTFHDTMLLLLLRTR